MARAAPSERTLVFLVGAVQFVNVLDFVMVMPLGPDFARALDIPEAHLGYVGGSYTLAASVSGFFGSFFLDRFDRRKALAVAMLGLVVGTVLGGVAGGLGGLLAARVLAGAFGGPATSLALSIVADCVPPERRGRAMGAVMSAFSVASILGIPAALELARQGGWRLPFFVVGGMGLVIMAAAIAWLPPLTGHLSAGTGPRLPLRELLGRREVQVSYLLTATVMASGFLVIPNLAAYMLGNLGLPREWLGPLYLVGGVVSLLTLQISGRLVDRFGSTRVVTAGAALILVTLVLGFLRFDWLAGALGGVSARLEGVRLGVAGFGPLLTHAQVVIPALAIFILFMLANGMRNVAYNALTSKVPRPAERARFQSMQSCVQHAAMAVGAGISSLLLTTLPGGRLGGLEGPVALSMGLTMLVPLLVSWLEPRVRGLGKGLPPVVPAIPPGEGPGLTGRS